MSVPVMTALDGAIYVVNGTSHPCGCPSSMRYGYVYILCSQKNGTLYIGVTSDLWGRLQEHKSRHNLKSFTAKHNVTRLVWFERHDLVADAIVREKAIKKNVNVNGK